MYLKKSENLIIFTVSELYLIFMRFHKENQDYMYLIGRLSRIIIISLYFINFFCISLCSVTKAFSIEVLCSLTSYIYYIIIRQIFWLARDWSKRVMCPNIPQLNLGSIREYSSIFITACLTKKSWRIINTSLHLGRKYARIFVLGHYLFLVAQFSSSFALGKLFTSRNR